MKKQYLDYAGLKRVLKRLLPGARKIWHGTEAEWEALSETERDKYDQAEVIDYIGSSSTTEYIRNQNILSDYETVTLPFTAQYDGELVANCPTNSDLLLNVNGVEIAWGVYVAGGSTSNSITLTLKKGDTVSIKAGSYRNAHARWYKLRDYTGR